MLAPLQSKQDQPPLPIRSTGCQRGFTLLEVLVALGIAAVGLGAITKSMSQNITVADRLSEKLVATWVASNQLAEMHIGRQYNASAGGSVDMGGREWLVEVKTSATGLTEVQRADITVRSSEAPDRVAATLFGMVAYYP